MYNPSAESESARRNLSEKMTNSSLKRNIENGEVFYETPAAQGISGLFVALAIIISVHQASTDPKFDNVCNTIYEFVTCNKTIAIK